MATTGCSHRFTPDPHPVGPKTSSYEIDNATIAIINTQKDNSEKTIMEHAGHKYFANLSEWTESGVKLLQDEIISRGGIISEKPEKTISISITEVSLEFLSFTRRCKISLTATSSNGYSSKYEVVGSGGIGRGESYAINDAISSGVEAVLSDLNIANFISKRSDVSILVRIKQLDEIKKSGLISVEEYEIKKKQLIDEL